MSREASEGIRDHSIASTAEGTSEVAFVLTELSSRRCRRIAKLSAAGEAMAARPRTEARNVLAAIAGGMAASIVATEMHAIAAGLCGLMCLVAIALWLRERSVQFALWWIAAQNFAIAFLYSRLGNGFQGSAVWTALLASSEAFGLVFLAINWSAVKSAPWWRASGAYIAAVVVFEGIESGLHFASLNSVRAGMIPVVFCLLGAAFVSMGRPGEDAVARLVRTVVWVSTVGAASVLLDHFLLSSAFWSHTMKLGQYWLHVKHLPATYIVNGLPGNIVKLYDGVTIRRGIGIYGDPLAAGYSMAIGSICLLFSGSERRLWWYGAYGMIVAAVIVTGTRAAMVMIGIGVLGYLWSNGMRKGWFMGALVLAGILYGAQPLITAAIHGSGDVRGHLRSFEYIPKMILHPFGDTALSTTLEGAVFDYWDKGGVLLIGPAIIFMRRLYRCISPGLGRTILWALLLTSPISFELLGDTSCGAGWMIVGACAQAWCGRHMPRDPAKSL